MNPADLPRPGISHDYMESGEAIILFEAFRNRFGVRTVSASSAKTAPTLSFW